MQNDIATEKIIGYAFKIHKEIGPGFSEKIYQNALCNALIKNEINCIQEKQFDVIYDSNKVGSFRIDLLVDDKIIVEIKAVNGLLPKIFKSQVLSYLKAAEINVALLINFGNNSCEVKRYVHNFR